MDAVGRQRALGFLVPGCQRPGCNVQGSFSVKKFGEEGKKAVGLVVPAKLDKQSKCCEFFV